MRAREVVGRTIVEVRQHRTKTRFSGDDRELEYDWEVDGFKLDNGKWIMLSAIETDHTPIVTAHVHRPTS